MTVNKHFLIKGFEEGESLLHETTHTQAMAMLESGLSSSILSKVDIMSSGMPEGVQPDMAYSGGDDDFWPHPQSWFAALRPYKVSKAGVLTIPVRGVLLHGASVTYGRSMTGYEYIVKAVQRAEADPQVKAIAFHVDSPGGHVSGCFDTCDLIYGCSKPTVAIVADSANSAAYAIAASCKKIVGTQTCETGNIGVLATRVDQTKALEQRGLEFHYVTAPEGGNKADFHPGNPITKDQLSRLQGEVNETYELFVNVVARNRPITPEAIRATKALSFGKDASLQMGLIDMVASSVDIPTVAHEAISQLSDDKPADIMTSAQQEDHPKMDQAQIDAAIAAAANEAKAAATKRIADIMGCAEATGRETLAQHLAFNTDLDATAAAAALAASPVAAAAPVVDPAVAATAEAEQQAAAAAAAKAEAFKDAMNKNAPDLSANGGSNENVSDEEKSLNASLALARQAGISGYKEAQH